MRKRLLEELSRYMPEDAVDGARRDRIAAFVAAHADCFSRELAVGHVVASAWLVDAGRTRVLLHHHKKLDRWLQFGGHVQPGTDRDVLAAARRELAEESGLTCAVQLGDGIFDVDVHTIPATPKGPEHLHFDVRFAFAAGGVPACSEESHALAWFELDRVGEVTSEASLLRMAEKTGRLPRSAGAT